MERDQIQDFLYREEIYILTYIRFKNDKNKFFPNLRNEKDTFLIYRHQINVEKTRSGITNYRNPQINLERIMIGSMEEGLEK